MKLFNRKKDTDDLKYELSIGGAHETRGFFMPHYVFYHSLKAKNGAVKYYATGKESTFRQSLSLYYGSKKRLGGITEIHNVTGPDGLKHFAFAITSDVGGFTMLLYKQKLKRHYLFLPFRWVLMPKFMPGYELIDDGGEVRATIKGGIIKYKYPDDEVYIALFYFALMTLEDSCMQAYSSGGGE